MRVMVNGSVVERKREPGGSTSMIDICKVRENQCPSRINISIAPSLVFSYGYNVVTFPIS